LADGLCRAIGERDDHIRRSGIPADILQLDHRAALLGLDVGDRIVDIPVREEPCVPEPVEIPSRVGVEAVEHIPRDRVLAVPVVHKSVQAFPEIGVTEEFLKCQITKRGLAVFVIAVGCDKTGNRTFIRDDRYVRFPCV